MYDVITMGSATVDVFAKTDAEMFSFYHEGHTDEFIAYPSGSKILIEELDFQIGGGGTNTSVAFSRLGLKTAYIGRLGTCENSARILDLLKKEKIDFIGRTSDGQAGYSVILDSHSDDRTILTFKGLNNKLKYSDIDKKKLDSAWLYSSSLVGESYKTFERTIRLAKKKGMNVAFNPSSYLVSKGKKFLSAAMRNTDVVIMNSEEAGLLVGADDMLVMMKKIARLGPNIVSITDGAKGAYALQGKDAYFIPGNKVRVRETTGAGDAYASGLVAGLILKHDLKFGMNLGIANASSVVRYMGAKNRLLTYKQISSAIRKNKRIRKIT